MKSRLFIINLLLTCCFSVYACGPEEPIDPKYHWLFYTGYNVDANWQYALDERFKDENISFWHHYVKESVSRNSVEKALYSIDFLNIYTKNDFFRYLIKNKDTIALKYWKNLKISDPDVMKKHIWRQSAWYYSDSEKFDEYDNILTNVNNVEELNESSIAKCKNSDIRNRYVLQVMRKYFYDDDFQKCVKIWKKYGQKIPKSELRTVCLNYYGGALLRLGRKSEAATVYASIGYFHTNLHYDPAVLRSTYHQNPNNKYFEFMLQQFVNFYFDHPKKSKAEAFNLLADEVVRDGKSNNPALWKSAQAAIAYIDRNNDRALKLLKESKQLRGTPIVKENIRMMQLLFNSTRTDNDSLYEETLYPDLKWLSDQIIKDIQKNDTIFWKYDSYCLNGSSLRDTSNIILHRFKVLRRAVFLGIIPHFERTKQPYKVVSYLNFFNEIFNFDKRVRAFSREGKLVEFYVKDNGFSYSGYKYPPIYCGKTSHDSEKIYDSLTYQLNFDYNTSLFEYLDTANVETLLQYVSFLRSGGKTTMERFILKNSYKDLNFFYEIIGTKYLRKEQYSTASSYFRKVSDNFRKTQNIYEYLDEKRNPFAEKWITNQTYKGKFQLSFNPTEEYAKNPSKLTFCEIMMLLRKESELAKTAEERAYAAYAYALGLYQSNLGNAWALSRYSSHWDDTFKNLEDLSKDADPKQKRLQKNVDSWLNKAMKLNKDDIFTLKCKILHSKYRGKMKETIKVRESSGSFVYFSSYKGFRKDVRTTFCDRWQDYDAGNHHWGRSVWYY